MNWKMMRAAVVALLYLFFGAPLLRAADEARVPYAFIYKIQLTQAKLAKTYTNLQVVVRLQSRLPAVHAADLKVFIEAGTNNVPVTLGSDGRFTVAMRDDWVSNDAWLVVNQPKGTMLLDWNVALAGAPMARSMPYRELMKAVVELDPVQAEMAQAFPNVPRLTVAGLKLIFPNAKESGVVIRARKCDQKLVPDAQHLVIVPLDAALLEENPEVWMPVLPEKADVAFQKRAN